MVFQKTIINILIVIIISTLIVIALVYILFGLFLFFNQKSILYYPNNQDFYQCDGFDGYEKLEFNGTRFYFLQGARQDKVIVFYHGNTGSACDISHFKFIFERSNASLIFVEYAGYSNDDVRPSRDLILKDVENIRDYTIKNGYQKVVVFGQSIGSGAASYHAYLRDVDYLILVTPFSKLDDIFQSKYIVYPEFLLREKYDNIKWLQNYHGSLLIVHGDKDLVIPNKFSQELFEKVPTKNKDYVLIEGKGHDDIWLSSLFQNAIMRYLTGGRTNSR